MGFLLHRREDEFITTIYKRFVVYNFIYYVFLHPAWWGDFCRISFINSKICAIKLQTSMVFFYKHDLPTLHVFFVHWDFFRSHSFSLPHGPISRSIQIVCFLEVTGARTTSARSQEADQPIKILDPGESNDTWAQHLQLGCGRFRTNKNSGGRGKWWSYHVCFPPKKGLKVFWCQGANPKIKRKPRNNTWSWMNWDVWWVMSFFWGGDGLGLRNASSARLFLKPDPDERFLYMPLILTHTHIYIYYIYIYTESCIFYLYKD